MSTRFAISFYSNNIKEASTLYLLKMSSRFDVGSQRDLTVRVHTYSQNRCNPRYPFQGALKMAHHRVLGDERKFFVRNFGDFSVLYLIVTSLRYRSFLVSDGGSCCDEVMGIMAPFSRILFKAVFFIAGLLQNGIQLNENYFFIFDSVIFCFFIRNILATL